MNENSLRPEEMFKHLFQLFFSSVIKMHLCSHTIPSMLCNDLSSVPFIYSGEAFMGCSLYTWQLSAASQIAAGSCCPQVH